MDPDQLASLVNSGDPDQWLLKKPADQDPHCFQDNMDDVIVSLMSMGFDITDCQDAITFGKNTVEAAVEWLVAGKPGFRSVPTQDTGGTSLRLRPQTSDFESSSVPFVKPSPIQSDVNTTSHDQSSQSESSKSSQSEMMGLDIDQSESAIVSRLHLSGQQRKVKEGFEQKKRDEAKKQAMLEKKRQKEEHARVLKEIAEDREKKKLTMGAHRPSPEGTSSARPPTIGAEQSASNTATSGTAQKDKTEAAAGDKNASCLLQIRLPDGRAVRHSFPTSSILRDVWNFTSEHFNLSMAGYTFIQPFPHHEFSREEMLQSLTDLRLTPTGSLVLQKKSVTQSTEDAERTKTDEMKEEEREETPMEGAESHPGHVHDADPTYSWGRGNVMEGEGQQEEADPEPEYQPLEEGSSDDEEDDNIVVPGGPAGMFPAGRGRGGHGFPGFQPGGMDFAGGGMPLGGGRGMPLGGGGGGMFGMDDPYDHGGQVFGGVGQRLVPEGQPGNDDNHHQRSVRDLALERAQARQVHQAAVQPSGSAHSVKPIQSALPSLLLCCLKHTTQRLNDPRHQILSLAGISEDMAQVIITHLLKEKQLKPKTLNPFIPCYLRRLVLDCYPYVTNELLSSIRLHTNLSQLSLSSCSLITDQGLQCLSTLRKLKKLNLSCCRQLSNKVVPVFKGMSKLAALNLEGTGVSDPGVIEFLSTRPQHLQHLNLNRTEVTQAIISHLIGITTLKSLSLEDTKVASLTGVQELSNLESLNVARTLIVTESLLCLVNHPSLVSLNIANTDNVNGDQALQNLKGLNLQLLNLPSRHTTTSLGMQYLSGFPLISLDLTNFIFVGDEAMEHIGKITSLKKLLLCNTKLTDEGMLFLQGLVHLEVLDIDRTLVTNDGASIIGEFTSLLELSMVSTGITSRFLLSGTLNKCFNLTKLNLSKTFVTNKGLKSLVLPSLQLLNLDGTKVRPDIQELMATNCPRLAQVSLRNLEPYTLEDQEADMEVDP